MHSFAHIATALVGDVTNIAMLQTQSMQMRDKDNTIVRTPKLAHFGNNFGTFRHANFGIIGRNSIFMNDEPKWQKQHSCKQQLSAQYFIMSTYTPRIATQ